MKPELHRYLDSARDAMVWKLDGLSEYDARRPLTPTGTNLLGLIKHLSGCEAGYFGATFGRPFPEPMPWYTDDAEPNEDMWATPEESREDILGLYQRVRAHSDVTIETLELDTVGQVEHWPPDRRAVSLHLILVHMIAETNRHAGHADIVRELIDSAAGLRKSASNLPEGDAAWWAGYRERVEQAAKEASAR
ncbi:DinB family protein [Amycolatopsis sp.]|uniref:DinB family protein n=1 Tax=Amycolatopsis sp. TaxID=37632 RepID=UPI002B60D800|nr:DinB family protein [Amycolatopsis sp.]HVV13641.1 DinB family protein [Amycolatopsis sp.]